MMTLMHSLRVTALLAVTCLGQTVYSAPLFIDASVDLTRLKIADENAVGDSTTDSSEAVQAAIDYLAKNPDGGSLIFGPGVYRVGGLSVKPGVKIIGADRQQTIFRAANKGIMFEMEGGELHNFTAYGTPESASSGEFWRVGTGGVGKGGSAWTSHIIRVGNTPTMIAKDVVISNVSAKECRYDCLYTRGSQNLRVLDCEFDRAGRNLISMVGNDENFLISSCRFGSLWGLYHSDIEPNQGQFVRDGAFVNCEFDGRHAGDMNTDTWGAMFTLSGEEKLENRNISVIGCTFRDISVRVRGIFPEMQFLYNPQLGKFVKVRTNPTGELRDATIRGNDFGTTQKPMKNISYGVTFTGKSTFENNTPTSANDTKITSKSHDSQWKEDHPRAVKAKGSATQTSQKPVPKTDP
ncbi:Pectate lyase superfamily protein [Novipirellula galeiformis]|uniref:Pectate lyase superfamily protein n=1 Tax=Novipirellula galeiformis TaxID=2528004 RepID=A0A5C6CUS9_9BACT|nr:glycosyl hydrolase family 28-related protein [Novipirellula galeiformis]TWU26806.1 Pectate lyase superfamily protein [Novipirellula galeiformis]